MRRLAAALTGLALGLALDLGTAGAAELPPDLPPELPVEAARIAGAQAALEAARAALAGARGGEARLKALGEAVAAHEAALGALRTGLLALSRVERDELARLDAERARLAEVLAALQSLAGAPSSALLAHPAGPLEAGRAAMLMVEVTPAIDARMREIGTRLDRLAQVRGLQETARDEAMATLTALQDLRAATAQALAGRAPRASVASRATLTEQAERAGSQAENLGALAAILAASLPVGGTPRAVPFAPARGAMPLPVTGGEVIAGFGKPDPWGHPGSGISVSAPAYAQISAPWAATVRFAGDLIGHGKVVVLEPEPGYLIVIAGLGRIDRAVGEAVLTGERLGDLGGPLPTSEEFFRLSGDDIAPVPRETFYIEVRQDGEAVDPAPWIE